jgi:diguanylate cyclase
MGPLGYPFAEAPVAVEQKHLHTRLRAGPSSVQVPIEAAERPGRGRTHPMDEDLRREWLAYGSKYDIQTGLLNPHWFQKSVDAMVRNAEASGGGLALLWIDVLNLRKEFSRWGWSGADALVGHIARALRSAMDEDALISRFSRCFVICMRESKSDPAARRRLQSVVDQIARPVAEFGTRADVAAGVAFYPDDAESAEDLARYASLAAEIASEKGARTVLSFQPGMNSRMMRDHQMEQEIEKALDTDQLQMFYQPKVNLTTGQTTGAEALMRWTHPEWGDIPASEFIPIAERSSLIRRIFEFSLRTALRDARQWIELGIAPPLISVNVSPANLRRDDIARTIRSIMAELPIDPMQLELEVTESLLLDDEKLFSARVRQLKTIGVRVAIDDFGTRYTGFDLLSRVPLDTMKIDRCFVRGIHRSADLRALCNTIVAMGRQLKMRTVAEGIEEQEEIEILRQIGCDAGQGYLLHPPTSADNFASFVQQWPQRISGFGFPAWQEPAKLDSLCGIS